MEGSSPGTSVNPPSLGGEISGAREACPSPCNRKCAPLECTFELPKSIQIWVKQHEVRNERMKGMTIWGMKNERNDEVGNDKEENSTLSNSEEGKENNEYLRVKAIDRDGNFIGEDFELSWSNFMRTISTSSQVEKVRIDLHDASQKTSRALIERMKTIPSLKSLHLEDIRSSELSVSDAEGIFSAFGPHSTLQTGGVAFNSEPTEAAIVKVLVDALLQNQVLRQFTLRYNGHMERVQAYTSSLNRKERAGYEGSIMRELSRYLKSPTNVLTELEMCGVEDGEVIQLADTLALNKKLQKLVMSRIDYTLHREGIGRIGEALRTNTVLEELGFYGHPMLEVEEMEALVGALVPDADTKLQPNTHLHTLRFKGDALPGREGMEQLATLLRSNTSLLHLDLFYLSILERKSQNVDLSILERELKNVAEYAEMLFTALRFNTSLEFLDLSYCDAIRGDAMLGMIMDMLLHNRSLRAIKLEGTRLERDGDAEVVYAELRRRNKEFDWELEKTIGHMERVPPNSARVFLCGNPEAGKTTLCQRWMDIQSSTSTCRTNSGVIGDNKAKLSSHGKNIYKSCCFIPKGFRSMFSRYPEPRIQGRTRGIEVHKMVWEDMSISLWDLAGHEEYHTFHDMVLPNQSANGDCCFYFIVCNPSDAIQRLNEEEPMSQLKREIHYWLVFIASNTRRSKSYMPHVTIVMTHHDLWRVDEEKESIFKVKMRRILEVFRGKFELFLEFDKDLGFFEMDNINASSSDPMKLKHHMLQCVKEMSAGLPSILKASVDFQSTITKWSQSSSSEPFVKWDVFTNMLFEQVDAFGFLKDVQKELSEKIKKYVAISLHNGGHIMYFEETGTVILNPHWFCQTIIGEILFYSSKLNQKGTIAPNGIISRQDFKSLVLKSLKSVTKSYDGHDEEILMIMSKLHICYEDGDKKIMIPSLLVGNPIPTHWEEVFVSSAKTFTYVGLRLKTADDSITKLTQGFFPRLQVYLRNNLGTKTYRLYSNTENLKLFCKGISFIVDGVELFILLDMEDSINIISRYYGGGDSRNRDVHKKIMGHVNDLRQTPTLGCPGVVFEEHVIYPYSVENALGAKKLKCISKKQLREKVDTMLQISDFTYTLDWEDEERKCRFVSAKELLGEKEWLAILQRGNKKVTDMEDDVNLKLPATNSTAPAAREPSSSDFVRKDSIKRFIEKKFEEVMLLIQNNHEEVMKKLDELEKNIMVFQEKLTSRVCSNIDSLMVCLLELNKSNIPKLPFFTNSAGMTGKHILLKMVPGIKSYQLHFRCEHRDGFHNVEDQPGCEVEIGNDQTRKFGIVMYWGLTISVMLLKVGAHVTAGMGSMVPDLTARFASVLDSPGLLDLAQPRGEILECLPEELKKQPHINLQDNEEAKAWLVQILDKKCPLAGDIQRMFKLTPMVYTSKSNQKGGIAWLCDSHKDMGERDGSLMRS